MSTLAKRIIMGLIGIPFMIWMVILGSPYFTIFFAIVAVLALRELYMLLSAKGFAPHPMIGMITGFVWMLLLDFAGEQSAFLLLLVLSLAGLSTLSLELVNSYEEKHAPPAGSVVSTLGAIVYVPVMLSNVIALREFEVQGHFAPYFAQMSMEAGSALVILLFIGVWAGDTFAYFGGMAFGKRPLMSHISPKKTIEGAIIGFLGTILTMLAGSYFLMPAFPLWLMLIGSVLIGLFAPIGDLVESMIKRDAHVKDSSELIPGHGGAFDRFDSMLFAAPIFYGFIKIISMWM
jgi:phosphatidate cytidylyltransferase